MVDKLEVAERFSGTRTTSARCTAAACTSYADYEIAVSGPTFTECHSGQIILLFSDLCNLIEVDDFKRQLQSRKTVQFIWAEFSSAVYR
jgi:hypothetical protein